MSQDNDYQKLARQFVDLWQEQIAAQMNDSEFIRAILLMMQSMPLSAKDGASYANSFTSKPPGGASAASDAGDAALARIELGLATLAKRIDRLERGTTGRKPATGHGKIKPGLAGITKRSASGRGGRSRSKKKNH